MRESAFCSSSMVSSMEKEFLIEFRYFSLMWFENRYNQLILYSQCLGFRAINYCPSLKSSNSFCTIFNYVHELLFMLLKFVNKFSFIILHKLIFVINDLYQLFNLLAVFFFFFFLKAL